MNMLITKFKEVIANNSEIEQKEDLLKYVDENLKKRIYLFNEDDVLALEMILKSYNYDLNKFSRLLDISYWVRNSVSKDDRYRTRPTLSYVQTINHIFDYLSMVISTYNTRYMPSNVAISKCAYSLMHDDNILNSEYNYLAVAKKILDMYSDEESRNSEATKVMSLIHRINRGFQELEEKYTDILEGEEFYSLFEVKDKMMNIYFSDIIKEFYPQFKNRLFIYIKELASSSIDPLTTEDAVRHLRNLEHTKQVLQEQKVDIQTKLKNIDIKVKNEVENTCESLIETIKGNEKIDVELQQALIAQINHIFNKYHKVQDEFLETNIEVFLDNCLHCVNDLNLIEETRNQEFNELIKSLLSQSKDFFIEYDSKKLKEIYDFLSLNTSLNSNELKKLVNKCGHFFKDADVEKLKVIQEELNEFKREVNSRFSNKRVNADLFEKILVSNPKILLEENNISEILSILKGDTPFKIYGYTGEEVSLNKEFLTYDFYKKIISDDCNLLFKGGLTNLNSNLNFLQNLCERCDINMKYLKLNEVFLYSLLSDSLYHSDGTTLVNLSTTIGGENTKVLLEKNPEILKMKQKDLNVMVKRSLLNCNSTYNFYDLLFSELYSYNSSVVESKKSNEDKSFRYYNLGIDTESMPFDLEEILTSSLVDGMNISAIEKAYKQRQKKIKKLNLAISSLDKNKEIEQSQIKPILKEYRDLYGSVPDLQVKNQIFITLDNRKILAEQQISDLEESLQEKEELINVYNKEAEERDFIEAQLTELLEKVSTPKVKADIKNVLKTNNDKRMTEGKKRLAEELEKCNEITQDLKKLDEEVDTLNFALCQVDFLDDENINRHYVDSNVITLNELLEKSKNKENGDMIELDDNVVIFSDNVVVNTKDFLNDSDCVDKLYKFLVDPTFSVKSIQYMSDNSQNADGVEKYRDQREKMWSRRESRTPVRVYYIPVHTKHFTVYYIINIDKDTVHANGGISDGVYKSHVNESERILKHVNSLSKQEAIEYAKEADIQYKEKVKSLIKRKNKR